MIHVVMYSAGGGSWKTATRIAERHGTANLLLLFTDTLYESADTYRFLILSAAQIYGIALPAGTVPDLADFPAFRDREAYKAFLVDLRERVAPLIPNLRWIADGRDIWDVFRAERFLGNSGVDPCSKILKRQLADRWMRDNLEKANSRIYVGIDWTEAHRFDDGNGRGVRPRRAADGWTYEAPLTQAPFVWRPDIIQDMRTAGLPVPLSYIMGFSHNNCNRFCIKAGHDHYINLLNKDREHYLHLEDEEEKLREYLNADVSVLTDRSGDGKKKVLTLKAFRIRFEAKPQMGFDFMEENADFLREYAPIKEGDGGCGCMLESDDDDWTRALDERLAALVAEKGLGDNALKAMADELQLTADKVSARVRALGLAPSDVGAEDDWGTGAPAGSRPLVPAE